jgi:hypothetical protein
VVTKKAFTEPAMRAEIGFVLGEVSLVIRDIAIALMAKESGDQALVAKQIETLRQTADRLWADYEKILKDEVQ